MSNLADVGLREEVVIKDFNNDHLCIKRLLALGIEPGSIVRVEYGTFMKGTICISNKNRMIALDKAEAEKILVTPHPQAL